MSIHSTAVIDPGAKLGEGVQVGPLSVIEAGAEIGDGCVIGPHAVIHGHTRLGARCTVHAGAVLGDLPQDLSFAGVESFVRAGEGCTFREGVTVNRGTAEGSSTVLGDGCYLMANSHLGHNVELGDRVILANNVLLAGYVYVGEGVFFGGAVIVHQFVRIGRLAMLGGGCGIGKDVPPFCMTKSMGADTILGLNVVGLRRSGLGGEDRKEIKKAFRILYQSGLNVTQAKEALAQENGVYLQEILAFIEGSKRGLCGGT